MSRIELTNVTKRWGQFYAVDNLSMVIEDNAFVTLLGPSGCGKTTTLRMIAGFESPDAGEIYIGDTAINELTPNKRDTAMVFQSYALFPHYNVYDNVAYGLKLRHLKEAEIRERVMKILSLVELDGMEGRMTNQLSGGQQQRVAPSVLLFDEPLSNLDAKLRVSMRTEIRRIQHTLGITAVYVTHDQAEAMSISDRIIVMKGGVIEQMGTPKECYYHPANAFVADFIGEANFLDGEIRETLGAGCRVTINGKDVLLKNPDGFRAGQKVQMVLRPEAARIGETGMLPCRVALSCFMGAYQNYHVMVGNTLIKIADYCPVNKRIFEVDETAYLSFDADCVHILNAEA